MRSFMIFLSLCFVVVSIMAQSPGEGWELAKDKKGVKIYTRKAENSSIKDSKAYVTINKANLDQVMDFFMDFSKHHEWLFKIEKCEVLKKVSDDEYYAYYIASAPWPVSDRDVISHYVFNRSEGKVHVVVKGAPDFIPKKDDYVRITDSDSYWTFTSNSKGGVDVEYYNHASPGGSIPAWLANSAATDNPFVGLSNMKAHFDGE